MLPINCYSQSADSIPVVLGSNVQKSIYTNTLKKHGAFYNKLWGRHYQDLYYKPISARSITLNSLFGGLSVDDQLPKLHALILNDNYQYFYLLRPLGGSSSFLESKFFQTVYKKEDFKDTYLEDFISEAYTIVHPYMFVVADHLAKSVDLGSFNPRIFYIAQGNASDTIADGSLIKDKLVSISRLPEIKKEGIIKDVNILLDTLKTDKNLTVDTEFYIKARLFDMLIGDWNKIPENWRWIPVSSGDTTITYIPHTLDRSHAFTKVDGLLFKELLNMLGVGFITNYNENLKKIKKFNTLSLPLDMAIAQQSTAEMWDAQAKKIKQTLTDEIIDLSFAKLPTEMQNKETSKIKQRLKQRRNHLEEIALNYYLITQKNPIITGSQRGERFVIEQDKNKDLTVSIYEMEADNPTFTKKYSHARTKEIWIYGLGGDDIYEVNKEKKDISVLLIDGKGKNNYDISSGNNVFIYESTSEKERLKSQTSAKVIIPNDENALDYDYQKLRHSTLSLTPIGIYDTDLGLNIGTSIAYTLYGFRRAPFTRRHQISYDYINGFTYQGIFPSYDPKKSLHVAAYVGSPAYFSNFFGFGNDTYGYKREKRRYNRVNIRKYMLAPALYYNITSEQVFNAYSSFEVYKVMNPDNRDRLINVIFEDGNSIYKEKYYLNLGATYSLDRKMNGWISSISFTGSAGWNVNILAPSRNYPYINGRLGINIKITDRITFATLLKAKALFSNNYEFYQAATTELRGFRDNRFIGKQSFYQYSDIRMDMGRLHNPFTPLAYGLFVGVDHGRVWYPFEDSNKWHSSYGGGFWLTVLRKFTGKFSYFGSTDGSRFMFQLGMGF